VTDIVAAIKLQMEDNDHYDIRNNKYYISLTDNFNTLKAVLTLQGNCQVDFTPATRSDMC